MKPDDFSRKHTLPSQSESNGSTSDEHAGLESRESGAYEVNVNTPRKNPSKIYPIPEILQGKDSKRKQSANVKGLPRQKTFEILYRNRQKTGGRVCKNKSRNYEPESGSEHEPEAASSSENICAECEEHYATTER
jgi:hypothetical protein